MGEEMEFTPRIKQILKVLLESDGKISVKELAEQIGISKRTVQRELGYIQNELKSYDIEFLSKTGVGVWLEGSAKEKHQLLTDIKNGDTYDVSNREDRRKRLLLEILKEKGLKKLFYYSSRFQVSEATISTDLEVVEAWLEKYGVHIVRKPGSGITVDGNEENFRKAIRAFIDENIDTRLIWQAYDLQSGNEKACEQMMESSMGKVLDDEVLRRVMECIIGMNHARVLALTENSYTGLVIHITIAINRILKDETLETAQENNIKLEMDEDYALAETIVKRLEEEFEIAIPEVETGYICLHIKGSKHQKILWEDGKTIEMESRELQELLNDMINAFDAERAFYFKQDDEFIQGILAHLQPTLIRLMHDMKIRNPVLKEIQESYPDIYLRCRKVSEVLGRKLGKPVPEEETGFLAVHFGAALVRMEGLEEHIRQVHIGVVCSSGIGISRLMSSKLEKAFHDRIEVKTYGKNDVTPYIIGKTDFFISSLTLDIKDVPVILVNPLLGESDMEECRRMVYQYERMPEKEKTEDEFTMQLEEIHTAAVQINTVISHMEFFKVDNWITFPELLLAVGEILSPYTDRSELIQQDIMRRERIATQIFAEFGFALLHTRTKGVVRPSFSVCMTKDLTCFKDPYFKEINVVFIMLVPDDENVKINNEILGCISALLIEEYTFMEIVLSGDKEKIRNALSVHLKKLFRKMVNVS